MAGKGEVLEVVPRFLDHRPPHRGRVLRWGQEHARPQLVDSYLSGDLDLDSIMTRRISLDQVNEAFEAMERQRASAP